MKKITSFLTIMMLCCISAVAQYKPGDVIGSEKPEKTMIKIGTAQAEMVPNQWYFLHSPLEVGAKATDFVMPGDPIPYVGGLCYESGGYVQTSTSDEINALTAEEGVLADNWFNYIIRFVPVSGSETAYTVELANGKWFKKNPSNGTTTSAGSAGKFNFYLVTINGKPNTAGRFAWNQNYMSQRIVHDGAGDWWGLYCDGDGEVTAENAGNSDLSLGDAGIRGDMLWQLYSIVVTGSADTYQEAFKLLVEKYDEVVSAEDAQFVDNLINGVNVGTEYGNYRKEYVDAFLAIHTVVEDLIFLSEQSMDNVKEKYPTDESIEALTKEYTDAYNAIFTNKVPLAVTDLTPGYYTINSMVTWYETVKDTTYFTQEEADAHNEETGLVEGEEGFVKEGDIKEIVDNYIPAPIKSLCSLDQDGEAYVGWAQLQSTTEFLWKIEAVEGKPTEYRLINMYQGKVYAGHTTYQNAKLADATSTSTTVFDFKVKDIAPVTEKEVTAVNIRASKYTEGGYNYIMANNTNANSGLTIGWEGSSTAAQWYLEPVDNATAELWINGPEAQLKKLIEHGDSICKAFPAQLTIAKDLIAPANVANASTFSSPYHCPAEGSIAGLFDNNASSFWHSNWTGSGYGYAYSTETGTNYFVVNDVDGALDGNLYVEITRRNAQNDHVTELTVYGTNDAYNATTDKNNVIAEGEELYQWTELGILSLPYGNSKETVKSNAITFDGKYKYYKFVATATTTNRGYFHMAEFKLFPATETKRYPTTQYDVRKAEADALQAAVDAWTNAAFNYENVELLENDTFVIIYANLLAAAEAWNAVFVDPTTLRNAIANAPGDDMFVTGNNPGQWKEGAATPGVVVAQAETYNASGAYTAEQSQAWIDAINNAVENVYSLANPVESGKWYRIKFPTEQMFETYGWSKTYAQATTGSIANPYTSPELFGKKLATGTSVAIATKLTNKWGDSYTVTEYLVEPTDETLEGDGLYFFSDDHDFENGEDLFRFIQVTDSTFMLQNKANGLFVRAEYPSFFSAAPSLFQQRAIGAGANVLYGTNVLGSRDGYGYLYALGTDNSLITWTSNTLGTNSMFMIEEVEDVTEEPTTAYTVKMWPGKIHTYTMPVDVKVVEGATAYDATLQLNENDTTVVLKSLAADETIAHGTPFVLIADNEGDYITPSAMLDALKAEKKEELGVTTLTDSIVQLLEEEVELAYMYVSMEHGTALSAEVHEQQGLTGVMEGFTAKAGKAVVAKENGFAHTKEDTYIDGYTAYFATDFDATSADVQGTITIKIGDDSETGINEVLNKVAKNGNIYNAAGQLVGKGNINTVNNLPTGIYVVNGVKVTKK